MSGRTTRRRMNNGFYSMSCNRCGTPVQVRFANVLDEAIILCEACDPTRHMSKPRVTLFGAPDGQELARWTR